MYHVGGALCSAVVQCTVIHSSGQVSCSGTSESHLVTVGCSKTSTICSNNNHIMSTKPNPNTNIVTIHTAGVCIDK